jgi:hypothetical protein
LYTCSYRFARRSLSMFPSSDRSLTSTRWIWGSHRGAYIQFCLLEHKEWSAENQPAFRTNISSPSSRSTSKPSKKSAWSKQWRCFSETTTKFPRTRRCYILEDRTVPVVWPRLPSHHNHFLRLPCLRKPDSWCWPLKEHRQLYVKLVLTSTQWPFRSKALTGFLVQQCLLWTRKSFTRHFGQFRFQTVVTFSVWDLFSRVFCGYFTPLSQHQSLYSAEWQAGSKWWTEQDLVGSGPSPNRGSTRAHICNSWDNRRVPAQIRSKHLPNAIAELRRHINRWTNYTTQFLTRPETEING